MGEPLCHFLGVPVPNVPFPRSTMESKTKAAVLLVTPGSSYEKNATSVKRSNRNDEVGFELWLSA